MFNYNQNLNGDPINYCLNLNGNFVNGEDFSVTDDVVTGDFDWVDIKLCHPAKMVKTNESLGTTDDNSTKNKIYDRFSKVLWTGHTDTSLRYIELTSRTEMFRVAVSNWDQIKNAIEDRSDAHIFLTKDIVVQGIIEQPFTGTVEGNGFAFVSDCSFAKVRPSMWTFGGKTIDPIVRQTKNRIKHLNFLFMILVFVSKIGFMHQNLD